MSARRPSARPAEHRPARRARRRKFRHDCDRAVDAFTGFGGLTKAMQLAGYEVITAANHSDYKLRVHEANHPETDHLLADLVDEAASDYRSARDLPPAELFSAGVSCTNHSGANTMKAYERREWSLFDRPDDPEYDDRVTRSEKDRATANCVLHYADEHHPRQILVECTTELQSWGPALPGRKNIGDGSTFRWWLKQFVGMDYEYKILYLNTMFFKVGQSRDRLFIIFWKRGVPAPDLEHRPTAHCSRCDRTVESVWSWKTGVPPSGLVRYGQQYQYCCPSCGRAVLPAVTPSVTALDLTDLGTRIGDKPIKKHKDGTWGPMASATMGRAERCRIRFADFPAVLMPAKAVHGVEKHPWQPMSTQTSQQETAIISTGAVMVAAGNGYERPGSDCRSRGLDEPLWTQPATSTTGLITPPIGLAVDNFQGAPRGAGDPLATQGASETMALVSSGVIPFRQNTLPTSHGQAMPTVTADQIPGLLSAAGWFKQNGSGPDATAPHPLLDPFGTLTSRDTTGLLLAEWRAALADIALEDCYFRMMSAPEIGRGCGFDVDFPGYGYKGTFIVWGSARDQVDGYGNAVTPAVGEWIGRRLRAALHSETADAS